MRQPSKRLMNTDFVIQMILLVPMIFSSLFAIIENYAALLSLFLMFILGVWQTLSSLYTNIILKLKSRRLHPVLVIIYFVISSIIVAILNFNQLDFNHNRYYIVVSLILGMFISHLIAIYYAFITYKDCQKLDVDGRAELIELDLDGDILDEGMVGEE